MRHLLDLFARNTLLQGKFLNESWQSYIVVERVEKWKISRQDQGLKNKHFLFRLEFLDESWQFYIVVERVEK